MDQEHKLLLAFLGDPDTQATASAYLDWLERQDDFRGEYLRLLLALGEPTDAQAAGPERLRLRQLRERVDAQWANMIDRTRVRTEGLYQADDPDGREQSELLRFYSDGVVLAVSVNGRGAATAGKVWKWLTAEESIYTGRWTLSGDQLSFFIGKRLMDPQVVHPRWSGDNMEDWRRLCEENNAQCMCERTDYAGVVGHQTLALRWHSHLNGAAGASVYRFVSMGSGQKVRA